MHGHQAANTEVAAPCLGGRCRNGLTDDLQPRCWGRGSVGPLPLTQLVFRPRELWRRPVPRCAWLPEEVLQVCVCVWEPEPQSQEHARHSRDPGPRSTRPSRQVSSGCVCSICPASGRPYTIVRSPRTEALGPSGGSSKQHPPAGEEAKLQKVSGTSSRPQTPRTGCKGC